MPCSFNLTLAGEHSSPLRDSVGFRAVMDTTESDIVGTDVPGGPFSCGLWFTLWNEILRSRCSLKDDKVKSADGGEVRVRVIEFLSDIRPILLIHR